MVDQKTITDLAAVEDQKVIADLAAAVDLVNAAEPVKRIKMTAQEQKIARAYIALVRAQYVYVRDRARNELPGTGGTGGGE